MSRSRRLVWLAFLLPVRATAHEFWLEPRPTAAASGDTVVVRAFVGTGYRGEPKPYAPARAVRLELRTSATHDLKPLGRNGDILFASFVAPDAGGALVAYESNFAAIEMDASKFEEYLIVEGLDETRAARRSARAEGPARERYARCCKVWIAGTDAARVQSPVGLTHEIVPLGDPCRDARLAVRVLFRGRPRAGALVRAWCAPPGTSAAARDSVGPACETRTNAKGEATLAVDRPGAWLLSTVHMLPAASADADWESWWASLTFERPAP